MKTVLIIQARMSSSRFPRKMLAELEGLPLFEFVYRRCLRAKADEVVLATSEEASDDELAEAALSKGFEVFRGSLDNVLGRFIACAEQYKADEVIRLCGDSPFVDIDMMDRMCEFRRKNDLDFAAPERGTFIPAFDSEVFTFEALKKAEELCSEPGHREHVTLFIRQNPEIFKCGYFDAGLSAPEFENGHLTVDYEKDLDLNKKILDALPPGKVEDFSFTSDMILEILKNSLIQV